ncbi:MAG: hypothetical protein K6C12_15410 [Oscillospiraceae bacterium]|nr:hypothetical protein [Oscillospiraceae bacterium]
MKKTLVLLCLAALILLALAAVAPLSSRLRQEAEEHDIISTEPEHPESENTVSERPDPESTVSESAEPENLKQEAPETEVAVAESSTPLTPELLREKVLLPALSCPPGTAGSSLKAAHASAVILDFATGSSLRLTDQESLNRTMTEALALLDEEERSLLQEALPGLLATTDETIEVYPENSGLYEDAGCSDLIREVLARPDAAEDWAVFRTALESVMTE